MGVCSLLLFVASAFKKRELPPHLIKIGVLTSPSFEGEKPDLPTPFILLCKTCFSGLVCILLCTSPRLAHSAIYMTLKQLCGCFLTGYCHSIYIFLFHFMSIRICCSRMFVVNMLGSVCFQLRALMGIVLV